MFENWKRDFWKLENWNVNDQKIEWLDQVRKKIFDDGKIAENKIAKNSERNENFKELLRKQIRTIFWSLKDL
jgi:hypothetical protein